MLKFYSYYSVGGYKDFLLGDSESQDEATYYLPLLPILEEKAKDDKNIALQVEELKALPSIKQLSADNSFGLPPSANVLFSHAGYKLIYKHLEGNKYALSLRDIMPNSKDETGRAIPFLFVIVGDAKDVHFMDIIATYFSANIKTVERSISQLLYMDFEKNGLRFDLMKFNTWLKDIVNSAPSTNLSTLSGSIKIHVNTNSVALLIIPSGVSREKAFAEQQINDQNVVALSIDDIISADDPQRMANMLASVIVQLQKERARNQFLKKVIIAAGVIGLLIGCLMGGTCSR